MIRSEVRWVNTIVAAARRNNWRDQYMGIRHVLHGLLSLLIKRQVDDWESAGLTRPEALLILRETYNDLAPAEEQWGHKERPMTTGSKLPGE